MRELRKAMRRGLLAAITFLLVGSIGGCAADTIFGDDDSPPPPGCRVVNGVVVCT